MNGKVIKMALYLGVLALIVWAVARAFGRQVAFVAPRTACGRDQKANGSVWARKSVPVPSTTAVAFVAPSVYQIPAYQR